MKINKYIDHTLLKADSVQSQFDQLIDEAKTYDFASVCVNPCWVAYAAEALKDSDVKVCTVIGFPLGANTPAVKAFEARDAIKNGADEVDMVI
ncbi:deoxyribose-phosphate aldolase, partial [Streptococcus pyogenes]